MEYLIGHINNYSEQEICSFYESIPNVKKEKISKIKNILARKRSIIGEILLNKLVSNYHTLEYSINKYGKPYFNDYNYYFNISHSYDYVITVVSKKEIGIDIEKIRKTSLNSIHYFATAKEQEYILSSTHNIEERLFKIYTLKEAYFKMIGTNLDHVLDIEFIIEGDSITCSDSNITVGFIHDIDGYIISYCERK